MVPCLVGTRVLMALHTMASGSSIQKASRLVGSLAIPSALLRFPPLLTCPLAPHPPAQPQCLHLLCLRSGFQ